MSKASEEIELVSESPTTELLANCGQHLDLGLLAAMHGRPLTTPEQARVKDHLIHCPQCFDVSKRIGQFMEGLPLELTATDLIDSWERFRQTLSSRGTASDAELGVEAAPHAEPTSAPRRKPPRGLIRRRAAVKMVIAFSLIILTGAGYAIHLWISAGQAEQRAAEVEQQISHLWGQFETLEREHEALKESAQSEISELTGRLKQMSGPHLNWPVYDVMSTAFFAPIDDGKGINQIKLPAGVSGVNLILTSENPALFPDYRLEMLGAEENIIWQGDGLRRNQLGAFNVTLTREMLVDHRSTIKVYGKSGTRLKLIDTYPLRVVSVSGAEPGWQSPD